MSDGVSQVSEMMAMSIFWSVRNFCISRFLDFTLVAFHKSTFRFSLRSSFKVL